jgi:hypothetical protein
MISILVSGRWLTAYHNYPPAPPEERLGGGSIARRPYNDVMTHVAIQTAIATALRPAGFFVGASGELNIEIQPADRCRWEIFRGHLLGSGQTRLERSFFTWNVCLRHPSLPAEAPLVSVKWDPEAGQVYVTRSLYIYGWEAVQEGPVIGCQETRKWVQELVATVDLNMVREGVALQRHLELAIFLAVVGTSRLPITSVESPLPAYSLGMLGYFPSDAVPTDYGPVSTPYELLERGFTNGLTLLQRAKLLETVLRAIPPHEVGDAAQHFHRCWSALGLPSGEVETLFQVLFNHVALSPYTSFMDNLVAFLLYLAKADQPGPAPIINILSYYLRHLSRHLTAFDLVTFHNRGANYPDALALDTLLPAYVQMMDCQAEAFFDSASDCGPTLRIKRLRRRALRQGWFLRKQYEGQHVPDEPTSPGENLRVMPEPFHRVPEEQIHQPAKRRRVLFSDRPAETLLSGTARRLLQESVHDLKHTPECRELGMAVYLDRPLGVFKQPGEVDRTPLLTYEAFSRQMAQTRLDELWRWGLLTAEQQHRLAQSLREKTKPYGIPVSALPGRERPGVAALEDARRAAPDFVVLRTTNSSLDAFLSQYDFRALQECAPQTHAWLFARQAVLLLRSPISRATAASRSFLTLYDKQMQPQLELGLAGEATGPKAYKEHCGIEYLLPGLRILRVWEGQVSGGSSCREISDDNLLLPPRLPSMHLAGER